MLWALIVGAKNQETIEHHINSQWRMITIDLTIFTLMLNIRKKVVDAKIGLVPYAWWKKEM